MIRGGALLAALAVLAGCGAPAPPSEDEIRAEAAKLEQPLPGRYTTISQLVDFDAPGATPDEAERLRASMTALAGQNRSLCLTQREAEKGFEEMLRTMQGGKCRFTAFAVDDGALDAAMACTDDAGLASQVRMQGTGSADRSHVRLTIAGDAPALPGGRFSMVVEVDSLREGPCDQGL